MRRFAPETVPSTVSTIGILSAGWQLMEGESRLPAMGPQKFVIGDVLHKTRLEIDEEGTVAAAATGVIMQAKAMRPEPPKVLVFDRPFALVLCEPNTGATLFAGVIYAP